MGRIEKVQLKVDEVNERLSLAFGFKVQTGRRSNYEKWALVEEKIDFNDLFTKRYIERKNVILIPKEELLRKYDELLPDLRERKIRTILRKNYHGNFGEKVEEREIKKDFKKYIDLAQKAKNYFREKIENEKLTEENLNELFCNLTKNIIMEVRKSICLEEIYSIRYDKILVNTRAKLSNEIVTQKEYDEIIEKALNRLKELRKGRVEKISKKKAGEFFEKRKPEFELLLQDTITAIKKIKKNGAVNGINTTLIFNNLCSKKRKIEWILKENNLEKTVIDRIKNSATFFVETRQSYKTELKLEQTIEEKINEYISKELKYCEFLENIYVYDETGEANKLILRKE